MWRHRLNVIHWPVGTKLTVLFLAAILLPTLIMFVLSANQRITSLRRQNEIRLETFGPAQVVHIEQTFAALAKYVDGRFAGFDERQPFVEYFFQIGGYLSDAQRRQLETDVQVKLIAYMLDSPSLARIQLYDAKGILVAQAVRDQRRIAVQFSPPDDRLSPAREMILSGKLGPQTTITPIYQSGAGQPLLDMIFAFHAAWDTSGTEPAAGYIVFTQNLLLARDDPTLPDLYASARTLAESDASLSVFLLDDAGRLVSPSDQWSLLVNAGESEGFQAASRGSSGVAIYHSPLLGAEVMGYYTTISRENSPPLTVLVETPVQDINRTALREVLFTLLPITFGSLLLGLGAAALAVVYIVRPIGRLADVVRQISAGQRNVNLPLMTRGDEIGVLNNTFSDFTKQFSRVIGELEDRVAEGARNLEITLEIGRVVTSLHDLDELLEEVVNLIRDRFEKVYHVQIFLIEPHSQQARLRASTGAVGRQLLQRGHALAVGSRSVIGSVTISGHAVVALDTSNNPIHKRNEFLPDTRAEMALPLRIGSRIIGALDLQSKQPDAFSDQDVALFQGVADQITIAIENARLFAESSARLQEIERLNRVLTQAAWRDVERRRDRPKLSATAGTAEEADGEWSPLQLEAMRTRQIAERREGDDVMFAVPVILRDQVLGAVEWQVPAARYNHDARQTALELTARLALTADNIRLFEQSRRTAEREFLVNQITGKLTGTTDVEQILQTAVRELGLALRSPQTAIRLAVPTEGED